MQNFSTNKKFYILSLENNSSTLKFHIFSDTGKYEIKKVDLSTFNFFGKKEQEENFYEILTGSTFEAFLDLTTITQSTIPTLISGKRKLYINEKSITFSFDINPNLTQLFNVNLDDFSCTEEQLIQPDFGDSEFQISKSNSYLINNKLFQIKSTSDRLVLNIIDSDRTISRKFESIPENVFAFNNSEMIQEQMGTNKLTVFDKTKQFIRKTNNYNPTISVFTKGESYLVTIGSRMYIDTGASSVGPMYGAVGALLSAAMSKKSNFYNPNPYKNFLVFYTHCLFDKNLNHIEDKVQKTAFDVARKYADNLINQTNTTFFKFNSKIYVGSFDSQLKKYIFKGFTD